MASRRAWCEPRWIHVFHKIVRAFAWNSFHVRTPYTAYTCTMHVVMPITEVHSHFPHTVCTRPFIKWRGDEYVLNDLNFIFLALTGIVRPSPYDPFMHCLFYACAHYIYNGPKNSCWLCLPSCVDVKLFTQFWKVSGEHLLFVLCVSRYCMGSWLIVQGSASLWSVQAVCC